MDLQLKGKVAVVSGASKGMGKAISLALAAEGCRVCMVARTEAALEEAASELRSRTSAEAFTVAGDVSDPSVIADVMQQATKRWGGADIVVNNAGGPPPGSFLDHDEAAWAAALNQNFMSVVRFSRAAAPVMKQRNWGRIINITSTIAKEPSALMVLSASSRAAVSAFSKAISIELAPFNITVNTVCPGGVQTGRMENLMKLAAEREHIPIDQVMQRSVASIPLGRFASPEEIADIVLFLASAKASYLTGVSLMADAGLTKSVF